MLDEVVLKIKLQNKIKSEVEIKLKFHGKAKRKWFITHS